MIVESPFGSKKSSNIRDYYKYWKLIVIFKNNCNREEKIRKEMKDEVWMSF